MDADDRLMEAVTQLLTDYDIRTVRDVNKLRELIESKKHL